MAYFHCLIGGGSSGGGYELTVTCDADFAGTTITATDGVTTLTQTCPSASPYEVTFEIPNGGDWTISGVYQSETVSTQINIPDSVSLDIEHTPDGSTVTPTDDIQIWLACADITDKSYTTLAEVLADTDTYQLLLANSNACDYMVRSTTWAVASGSVPTMTSNTTPTGYVASGSHERTGIEPYYQAFDDNYTNSWSTGTTGLGVGEYIDIELPEAICVSNIMLYHYTDPTYFRTATWELFGSNDGTNWTSIKNDIVANQVNTKQYYFINNTTEYKYYRLEDISGANYNDQIAFITELQLYQAGITTNPTAMHLLGKYDYASDLLLNDATWKNAICSSDYFEYVLSTKVPNMTSDNAPSGTVYSNSDYGFGAWKAFNGVLGATNDNNRWVSAQGKYGTDAYISYDFGESVYIAKAQIYAVLSGGSENPVAATLYIEGSNDNSSWTSITSKAMTTTEMSQYTNIDLDYASYRYYRAYFSQCNMRGSGSDYYSQIRILQLYGRHESNYVSGKVAIHGARSSSLYYKSGGSDVSIGTTDINTGIALVTLSDIPKGTYAIYDGVAKDPDDVTADYSKTVRINKNTVEVWLMPDNTLYWWGWQSNDIEDMSTANGWALNRSGFSYSAPTHNTNNITITSSGYTYSGVGTKEKLPIGTIVNAIGKATSVYSSLGGTLINYSINGKAVGDDNYIQDSAPFDNVNVTEKKSMTTTIENYAEFLTWANAGRICQLYAMWYE